MSKVKKILSVFLAVVMVMSCVPVLPFSIFSMAASADEAVIAVPEAIYLTPSTGKATVAQYFVNNYLNSAKDGVEARVETPQTLGYIGLNIPDAKSFSLSVSTVTSGVDDFNLTAGGTNVEGTSFDIDDATTDDDIFEFTGLAGAINGTNGVSAGSTALIKWTITVTLEDIAKANKTETYYAYSTLYAPYYQPVGSAAEAISGGSGSRICYLGTIFWVEGVHSATTSNYSGAAYWYPRTDNFLPMTGAFYSSGFNNTQPKTSWIQETSNGLYSSVTWVTGEGSNHRRVNVVSPLAQITVDTSRYNNFNQIPNFKVGYMITDSENTDDGKYYVADYTGYSYVGSEDGNDLGSYTNGGSEKDRREEYYNASHGTEITSAGNKDCNVKYHNVWNRAIATGTLTLKAAAGANETGGTIKRSSWTNNFVQINVTSVDKSSLRSAVMSAYTVYRNAYVNDSALSAFETALQNAANVLGNPMATASEISTATTNLTNARSALKVADINITYDNIFNYSAWKNVGITCGSKAEINEITSTGFTHTSLHSDGNANDGYINFSSASGYYVPVEPGETYTLIADVTTVDPYYDIFFDILDQNKSHVTYVNSSNINYLTATMPTNGYYVAVRFDANNYQNVLTVNNIRMYKHDGVQENITVEKPLTPVAYRASLPQCSIPTRPGYTFLGWYDADGNQIYNEKGIAVDSATIVTGDLVLHSEWEVNHYSITFDVDGGSSVNNISDYTIEQNIALTSPTKTGYSFGGWVPTASVGNWVAGTAYTGDLKGMYGDVTLKAKWLPVGYTITFNEDNGTEKNEVAYNIESNVNVYSPEKTGYTFEGWYATNNEGNWPDDLITAGEYTGKYGNVTLNASYKINSYTVKWVDEDGSQLYSNTFTYNTVPVYNGNQPSKNSNAEFNYTFAGWKSSVDGEVYATNSLPNLVAQDVTYTATYTSETRSYTVKWLNHDNTTLQAEQTLLYGVKPEYTGEAPVRAETVMYKYTFAGWQSSVDGTVYPTAADVPTVSGDVVYTATYKSEKQKYTVYWVNDDGTVLETDENVEYGTDPSYDGEDPTKAADDQYTYYFKSWSPVPSIITGDTTFKATYDKSVNKYKVTFVDEDGKTVLNEQTLEYGSTPEYKGEEPTKAATAEWTYTFDGWDKEISSVTGEATYKATYKATKNTYTITWYDEDGTTVLDEQVLEYGATPVYAGVTPSKTEVGKTWTFEGWDNEVETVTGNASYKATYSYTINKWTVTWVVDGKTLTTTPDVPYGTALSTIAPTLEDTADGKVGAWIYDDYITMPDHDITMNAHYSDSVISWIVDGVTVKSTAFDIGATVTGPADPTKAATDQYTYVFAYWEGSNGVNVKSGETFPAATTENVTYTAVFDAGLNSYKITFVDEDGFELHSGLVDYGTDLDYTGAEPSKTATDQYTYTFAGWSDGTKVYASNEIPVVTGNATYKATYTQTVNKYTIIWVDENGTTELDRQVLEYGKKPVYAGEAPSKASTEQYEYTFSGWSPEIETVTGNKTYKAVYTEAVRKYRVTWKNDNLTLSIDSVEYGKTPVYTGATPTKAPTDLVAYEFDGWNEEIVPVKGDVVYTAKFKEVDREFYVYFYVDGVNTATATTTFGQNMKEFLVDYPVPEKEGYTGFWTIVPETMPAMDITLEAVYNPKSYSVTITEDKGVTEKTATFGEAFSYVFTGETIPTGVRVTVNGATISSANYVYNALTGELTIYGSAIKGVIAVTARYTGGTIDVIINIYNGASTNTAESTAERTAYHTQIVPAEGYLLPKEVKVYVDGAYVANGYTYDSKTGKLTVNAEIVVGSLEIFTECPVDPNYNPDSSTDTDKDTTDECNCSCHSESGFVRFFFKIICFLRMIFGMDEYRFCDCGAAHW